MGSSQMARTWGRNIREQREARGWSLDKLGGLVGVSWQSVSKWERGQSMPTPENQARIAGALGTSVPMIFPIQPIAPTTDDEVAA